MKNLTFAELYEAQKPLRIAAFKKHYERIVTYKSIADAERHEKRGDTILKVTPLDGDTEFYILHKFDKLHDKMFDTGAVIGMWNELTVIGKTKTIN